MTKEKGYTPEQIAMFVNTIKNNINLFNHGAAGHIHKEAVLILGSTGSGKSTIMNILASKRMEAFKERGALRVDVTGEKNITGQIITDSTGEIVRSYAGEIKAEGFLPINIGHKADAETERPNYIMVNGKQFWDCPGFGETRGAIIDISNMYYINHILRHIAVTATGGVKFIIVQDNASTTTGGGKAFRDSINTICKMFPTKSLDELVDATTFVFTKIPANEEEGEEYLQDILARVTPKAVSKDNQRVIEFLKVMNTKITSIKHIEVPEVDSSKNFDNIDYIIAPVKELINRICNNESAIKDCRSGLVIGTDAHIVITELQQFWQAEVNAKCHKLKPLMKQIFEHMENTLGKLEITNKIVELLTVLKAEKQNLQNGGATKITLELVQNLEKLSDIPDYKNILSDIKATLHLIEFVGDIVSNQTYGACFTSIAHAILDSAEQFIDANYKAEVHEDTYKLEQYQLEANKIWWEKCGLVIAGTACTVGGIIAAGCALINPLALTGTTSLLSLAVPMFVKLSTLHSPAIPKLQSTSENTSLTIIEESIAELRLIGNVESEVIKGEI